MLSLQAIPFGFLELVSSLKEELKQTSKIVHLCAKNGADVASKYDSNSMPVLLLCESLNKGAKTE